MARNDIIMVDDCADLVSLQDLHLDMCDDEGRATTVPFVCMSAVAKLTRLTALELAQLVHHNAQTEGPDQLAVAVAALAGLTNLRSLRFHTDDFVLADATFSAVLQLTQLTELNVCRAELGAHTEGDLPLLQMLCFHHELTPQQMLETLSPLLPLPSLTRFRGRSRSSLAFSAQYLQESTEDSVMAAESRALKQIVAILAAAPNLNLHALCISRYVGGSTLITSPLMDDLKPLLPTLSKLVLWESTLSVRLVMAIANCLPGLSSLYLEECRADDACLWTISALLTGLTSLRINTLANPLRHGSWEAFAAVPRQHVLTVRGDAFDESHAVWDAAQLAAHGQRLMVLGTNYWSTHEHAMA